MKSPNYFCSIRWHCQIEMGRNVILLLFLSLIYRANAGTVASVMDYSASDSDVSSGKQPKLYCNSETHCPSYYDYCDMDTNECAQHCSYNTHWNGVYCQYCGYPDYWDGRECEYGYYSTFKWWAWLLIALAIVGIIAVSCWLGTYCFWQRRRNKKTVIPITAPAATRVGTSGLTNIAYYDGYGNQVMLSPNPMIYSIPTQNQFQLPPQAQDLQPPPYSASQGALATSRSRSTPVQVSATATANADNKHY